MALTPRPLPWGEDATTLHDVLEKGHRPYGSVEGWLRATRAVQIGCQVPLNFSEFVDGCSWFIKTSLHRSKTRHFPRYGLENDTA